MVTYLILRLLHLDINILRKERPDVSLYKNRDASALTMEVTDNEMIRLLYPRFSWPFARDPNTGLNVAICSYLSTQISIYIVTTEVNAVMKSCLQQSPDNMTSNLNTEKLVHTFSPDTCRDPSVTSRPIYYSLAIHFWADPLFGRRGVPRTPNADEHLIKRTALFTNTKQQFVSCAG